MEKRARPTPAESATRKKHRWKSGEVMSARARVPKRVYEKPNSSRIETSEHQMSHRQVDPALARLLRPLVILAQSAVAAQPGERPLDDPTPLQDLELLLPLGADDQLEDPAAELLGPLRDPSVVDPVGQDLLQP